MTQPAYPLIANRKYDHSSAEIQIDGQIYVGIESIDWSETLEPGVVRGTRPEKLARTTGEHDAEGNFSMPLDDGTALIAALGDGYGAKSFDIVINYSNEGQNNTNVVLVACRIKEVSGGSEAGGDPSMLEFAVDIMRVETNGLKMVPGMLT